MIEIMGNNKVTQQEIKDVLVALGHSEAVGEVDEDTAILIMVETDRRVVIANHVNFSSENILFEPIMKMGKRHPGFVKKILPGIIVGLMRAIGRDNTKELIESIFKIWDEDTLRFAEEKQNT